MATRDRLLQLFDDRPDWRVSDLKMHTGLSAQMIHRALLTLTTEGKVVKLGSPPKTIYRRIHQRPTMSQVNEPQVPLITQAETEFLQQHFLLITETGEYLEGLSGFAVWCSKRLLPLQKTITEYILTQKKYVQYQNTIGLINGTDKITNTKGYPKIYLDQVYYLDFYAIERFGKTKLGALLHFAKQGQNAMLMRIMIPEIQHKMDQLLQTHPEIDAIAYVPPTIHRKLQLMDFLATHLRINRPHIAIQKIQAAIQIPQKSLNKLEERINNAENSFAVFELRSYNKILLIDDAIGSGATINQIARKLKTQGVCKEIIGLAIVGSFKGFDVITDV
jgi:hypothetical protein